MSEHPETMLESKKYLEIGLEPFDLQILQRFLSQKLRTTGSGSYKAYASLLTRFFRTINKSEISTINEMDVEEYLTDLDNQPISYATKLNYAAYLRGFFDYYQKMIRRKIPTYYHPVPRQKDFNFTIDKTLSISEQQQKIQEQCFTPTQLIQILRKTYTFNRAYFIQILLLIFCGMRISECVSIKMENINLKGRYLMTGIEENARKSNKKGNKPLYFCFPQQTIHLIFFYIQELKEAYPGTEWLFPHGSNVNSKIRNLQRYLRMLNFQFPVKPHTFRKTLETYQLNMTNRIPLHFVELLSNHQITSVVMRNYNKVPIEERLKIYDECLPKEYIPILDFIETL